MTKRYDAKKAEVVKYLAKKFNREPDTIRKAIRGDLKSPLADEIKKEYNIRYAAVTAVLS